MTHTMPEGALEGTSKAPSWLTGRGPALAVALVAALGALYSYASVYSRAAEVFDPTLAYAFPVMVDALILACSVYYVGSQRKGRPQNGYRLLAHAGVAATVALNALASNSPAEVPWHVVAPLIWSALVELKAREALGDYRREHGERPDRIPTRLWLAAPGRAWRDWLWMARHGIGFHVEGRAARGRHRAAVAALGLTVPGWKRAPRRTRRLVREQLRSGALQPAALVEATGLRTPIAGDPAREILRAALATALETPSPASSRATRAPSTGTGRALDDDQLRADLREWITELKRVPSSREFRDRRGIGDVRARRILDEVKAELPSANGSASLTVVGG